MHLYSGSSERFVLDAQLDHLTGTLREAFYRQLGSLPSDGEVASWRNSLRAVADVVERVGRHDLGVLLEYQLPLASKRLDCMLTGTGPAGPQAVILELKQWSRIRASSGAREVVTYVGGGLRDVLHPAVQVSQYRDYLADTHTAFHEDGVALSACSYLHNYVIGPADVLLDGKFAEYLATAPLFGLGDARSLCEYLRARLAGGGGLAVLHAIGRGSYRPSRKLMQHVAGVIRGHRKYVLLDEQLVVYDRVFAAARASARGSRKAAIIVKGGPGTGKSVIALNLMADLLAEHHDAQYATGSKAFTETLREAIGWRAAPQFKYFNSYASAAEGTVDVLICDEAHRIRETSSRARAADRAPTPQVEEILRASRVAVFLIDEHQVVRPNEVGSVEHIREHAARLGHRIEEFELEAQFRCGGSSAFVNWVDNTLGVRRTAHPLWDPAEKAFELRIFGSPEALEEAIRAQAAEGHTARMTAGFCWPWSTRARADGTLDEDVVVGDYRRPWNARHDASRLAPGIPRAHLWAYDPGGIDQVGCIYTAQGFEFDYVGVIFGPDLRYDLERRQWVGDPKWSHDAVVKRSREQFVDLVKNTYRVLLTRGVKGCYVHFMDPSTERFVRSRIRAR